MANKIYLGLDIGTNSCGFAVTDENYNILKAKGNKLWGVRLFDEAKTAKDRRLKRCARRNNERAKLRTMWLQEVFSSEINKIDENFFSPDKMGIFCIKTHILSQFPYPAR